MNDCVFCRIFAGKEPQPIGYGLHEGQVASFEPLNPVTAGHLLFVPLVHVRDAADSPYFAGKTVHYAARWAALYSGPCNIITSVGAAATQTIFHLHVHVVPRREGDGLALPWTERHRDAAERIARRIMG